jgi:hypothetical protein
MTDVYVKIGDNSLNKSRQSNKGVFTYDPYMIPPILELAEDHLKAMRIGKPVLDLSQENIDEASGLPVDNEPPSICCDTEELAFISPGYPMYFQFIRFCILMGLCIIVFSSAFNIYDNNQGDGCPLTPTVNQTEPACSNSFYTDASLANQANNTTHVKLQSLINLGTIIILIVVLQFLRKIQRKTAVECDERDLTSSDFTVRVYNFPKDFTDKDDIDEEVKKFFTTKGCPGKELNVKQVSCIYDCTEKLELIKDMEKLTVDKLKLLARKKQGEEVFDVEIEDLDKQIKEKDRRVDEISKQLQNGVGMANKFTGEAFVTFETQQESRDVEQFWQDEKWSLCKKRADDNSPFMYRGKRLFVGRASEPSDVLWENAGIPFEQKLTRRTMSHIATFFILFFFGGVIAFINAAPRYIFEGDLSTSAVSILTSVGSFVINIMNYILIIIMKKLADYEKYSTLTDYYVSYTRKLTIAQFLNTSIISFLIAMISQNYWGQSGLVTAIIQVFIYNAIIPWVMDIIDMFYWMKVLARNKVRKNGAANMTQLALNKLFENYQFDFATKYATYLKTLLSAALYAPLVPSVMPIAVVGLMGSYWIDKFNLLKKRSRGASLGSELPMECIEFLESPLILFSAANFFYAHFVVGLSYGECIPNIIGLTIGILNAVLPMDEINKHLLPVAEEKLTDDKYSEKKMDFEEDYDRSNPATEEMALETYSNLRQKADQKLIKSKSQRIRSLGRV